MILRVLIAALAIWGMTWSNEAKAIYMVRTCQTVLVGWDGYEAIYQEQCRYENWGDDGGGYDPDPWYGGGGGGGGSTVGLEMEPDWSRAIAGSVPNEPFNSEPASCTTEPSIRWTHATQDMNAYRTARLFNPPPPGLYVIEYDDGATEVWWYTGAAGSPALFPHPKPGSLQCD
ncbi:MAG: hypothetical protein KA763_04985 [Xanthomonadales bacterium]|nr:hypothetical protein [Xanthomonadales bacterium]